MKVLVNSEVNRAILSAHVQTNSVTLMRQCFTVQMDNDPNHSAKAVQDLFNAQKWCILHWASQSVDLNTVEITFTIMTICTITFGPMQMAGICIEMAVIPNAISM